MNAKRGGDSSDDDLIAVKTRKTKQSKKENRDANQTVKPAKKHLKPIEKQIVVAEKQKAVKNSGKIKNITINKVSSEEERDQLKLVASPKQTPPINPAPLNTSKKSSSLGNNDDAMKWKHRFEELERQYTSLFPSSLEKANERFDSFKKSVDVRFEAESKLLRSVRKELEVVSDERDQYRKQNYSLSDQIAALNQRVKELGGIEEEYSALRIEHELQSGKINQLSSDISRLHDERKEVDQILIEYHKKSNLASLFYS